jgi:hypothetical protein
MRIDDSDWQPLKAASSMCESFESASKVTLERHLQSRKQHAPKLSTDAGIQIESSGTQTLNASAPILTHFECASKSTVERGQYRKQPVPIRSTEEGIQIRVSGAPANAPSSIETSWESASNVTV